MSRLIIPLFILLLLALPVSATYYIKQGGFLYEVEYSIYSNGTSALINAEVDNYGVTCGMDSCWAEVYDVYDYLLFFNGSRLYLLNFIPALLSSLPPYAPKNVSWVHFNGIKYVNGSWYVNVSVFAYSAETQNGSNLNYVFRLDTKGFCVKKVNMSWSQLKGSGFKGEVNGWRIEIPEEFGARWAFINNTWVQVGNRTAVRIPPSADFYLIAKHKVENSSYCRLLFSHQRPIIVNWTQFPVYFVLKKDNVVRNVTILYINTTSSISGFWFPGSVKIVNVTFCKPIVTPENATSNGTATQTSAQKNTTIHTTNEAPNTTAPTSAKTRKNICGPGLIGLLALTPLLFRKR